MMQRGATLLRRRLCTSTSVSPDVVIAGGGVMGSSIALQLAARRRDLNIVVVERDSSYKWASAPLSAGGIRQQFSTLAAFCPVTLPRINDGCDS